MEVYKKIPKNVPLSLYYALFKTRLFRTTPLRLLKFLWLAQLQGQRK